MTATATPRRALAVAFVAAAFTAVATVPAAAATPPAGTAAHATHHADHDHGESARLSYPKSVAVRVLTGVFEHGDTKVVDQFVRAGYVEHNPQRSGGAPALKNLARAFHRQFPRAEYDVKRVLAQGDLVLVHSHVVATPGSCGVAVFDIFRFQNGKIAEHWDTTQQVPATTANGNTMFSTESLPRTAQPQKLWLTAYNQQRVTTYLDQLMVQKDTTAIGRFVGTEFHQHNPNIPDGVAGLKAGIGGYLQMFPQVAYLPKRVIAEGDLVAVHSHVVNTPGERGAANVDLFRVRDGKLVEHWDVIQPVPATSANDNTMF
jgi:predicted SnoaL-like aldol condensation-catalyzing enzyme